MNRRVALAGGAAALALAAGRKAPNDPETAMRRAARTDQFDWKAFLTEWSQNAVPLLRRLPAHALSREESAAVDRGSLLEAPAGAAEIAGLEATIGRAIPPSYRRFLEASNGFAGLFHTGSRLLPAREVRLLADRRPPWLIEWETLTNVRVQPSKLRPLPGSLLPRMLRLDDGPEPFNDATLLDPSETDAAGDWRAVAFSDDGGGATTWSSFRGFMQSARINAIAALRTRAA